MVSQPSNETCLIYMLACSSLCSIDQETHTMHVTHADAGAGVIGNVCGILNAIKVVSLTSHGLRHASVQGCSMQQCDNRQSLRGTKQILGYRLKAWQNPEDSCVLLIQRMPITMIACYAIIWSSLFFYQVQKHADTAAFHI